MVERVLDPISSESDLETIGVYLAQFKKDTLFLNANRVAWRAEYPDQWVVVFGEDLVGVGETVEDALSAAQEKGAPRPQVAIEYLSSEPVKMILHGGRL